MSVTLFVRLFKGLLVRIFYHSNNVWLCTGLKGVGAGEITRI